MKAHWTRALILTALIAGLAMTPAAFAQAELNYEVTIYNLTKGQVFSPPIVVAHSRNVSLFEVGEPALPELALMAEDGAAGPLADLFSGVSEVRDAVVAAGPVPPGSSITVQVTAQVPNHRISVAGMLVNTNDAFFAVDTVTGPRKRRQAISVNANAYDAGSEANNEDCGFIPGPACGGAGAGVRDTADAEGFVYIHPGVHGIADLEPAAYDWRNPVARVIIRRVR